MYINMIPCLEHVKFECGAGKEMKRNKRKEIEMVTTRQNKKERMKCAEKKRKENVKIGSRKMDHKQINRLNS